MVDSLPIRVATADDAAAIRDIYAPFCESSAVTFEEKPPSVAALRARIQETVERYPWLVYEVPSEQNSTEVIGYAYADSLRKRSAYQWVTELSVYIKEGHRSSGIGSALYDALFKILKEQGIRDAYAVTTLPNPATVAFHENLGFERIVDFPAMGYTEGDWHDVAWWRIQLAPKDTDPRPIRPFSRLREQQDVTELVKKALDEGILER